MPKTKFTQKFVNEYLQKKHIWYNTRSRKLLLNYLKKRGYEKFVEFLDYYIKNQLPEPLATFINNIESVYRSLANNFCVVVDHLSDTVNKIAKNWAIPESEKSFSGKIKIVSPELKKLAETPKSFISDKVFAQMGQNYGQIAMKNLKNFVYKNQTLELKLK